MRKGYVFGSSTPRDLSHQKAKDKSSVLEALAADAVHDVRPFVKNMHNPNARSKSVPKGSKQFVFGSSTPREWSHHVKIPALHRAYDAKLPRKERSQTVSSLHNLQGGSIKTIPFEERQHAKRTAEQPATSREARNRHARVNLPPVPHTSRPQAARPKSPADEDEDDEAASEPDIKMDRGQRKEWANDKQKTAPAKAKPAESPKKQVKEPVVNHVIETDSELIFERSEELDQGAVRGKQVIPAYASYGDDEEAPLSVPVLVRAPDKELLEMSEDVQLSHPIQVEVAKVALNSPEKYIQDDTPAAVAEQPQPTALQPTIEEPADSDQNEHPE